jgi:hypothetical protein
MNFSLSLSSRLFGKGGIMQQRTGFGLAAVGILTATTSALGGAYSDAVLALSPTHYYRLNETTFGAVADTGTASITAKHEGVYDVNGTAAVGDNLGVLAAPGPNVDKNGNLYLGFDASNKSLFANNAPAVDLGPGETFGDTTMTVAMWFKTPCNPDAPGEECTGPPASSGGERIFSNNFEAQDTGGTSDLDDLGHFQIDYGWGTNLVISIDNRFNEPLKSNFQVAHGDLVVKDNNWHHIVASRNGDDLDNVILVVDGENITQDRWVDSEDSWGVTAPFDAKIGTRTTAPDDHTFNGWLDETAIWLGRQLTVEEAQQLYQAAVDGSLPGLLGDVNLDGVVNGLDVDPFVDVLLNGPFQTEADMNEDGEVNGLDVDPFVAEVVGGQTAVPEPTTLVLAVIAALAVVGLRRKSR